jgi:topoisomerase-4 subunit A
MVEKGVSTLTGQQIWFDWDVYRLNTDQRGQSLGEFKGNDKILIISKLGYYCMTSYELSNHYENDLLKIEKYKRGKTYSVVYYDGEKQCLFLKRFELEESDRNSLFIPEEEGSYMVCISEDKYPQLKIEFGGRHKKRPAEVINVAEFIGVKGYKAKGKRLTLFDTGKIEFIEPLEIEDSEIEEPLDENGNVTENYTDENDTNDFNEEDDIPFEVTNKDGEQKNLDF